MAALGIDIDMHDLQKAVVISNPQGLHARPAHAFVSRASQFASKITVTKEGETVDGKSILDLLTLAAVQGTTLLVRAQGEDAAAAVESLSELLENLDEEPAEPLT